MNDDVLARPTHVEGALRWIQAIDAQQQQIKDLITRIHEWDVDDASGLLAKFQECKALLQACLRLETAMSGDKPIVLDAVFVKSILVREDLQGLSPAARSVLLQGLLRAAFR